MALLASRTFGRKREVLPPLLPPSPRPGPHSQPADSWRRRPPSSPKNNNNEVILHLVKGCNLEHVSSEKEN